MNEEQTDGFGIIIRGNPIKIEMFPCGSLQAICSIIPTLLLQVAQSLLIDVDFIYEKAAYLDYISPADFKRPHKNTVLGFSFENVRGHSKFSGSSEDKILLAAILVNELAKDSHMGVQNFIDWMIGIPVQEDYEPVNRNHMH